MKQILSGILLTILLLITGCAPVDGGSRISESTSESGPLLFSGDVRWQILSLTGDLFSRESLREGVYETDDTVLIRDIWDQLAAEEWQMTAEDAAAAEQPIGLIFFAEETARVRLYPNGRMALRTGEGEEAWYQGGTVVYAAVRERARDFIVSRQTELPPLETWARVLDSANLTATADDGERSYTMTAEKKGILRELPGDFTGWEPIPEADSYSRYYLSFYTAEAGFEGEIRVFPEENRIVLDAASPEGSVRRDYQVDIRVIQQINKQLL